MREAVLLGMAGILAGIAMAQTARDIRGPAAVVQIDNEPAPKIVIDPPLADSLVHGRVVIQYRAENLRIVPVFGPKALDVSPRIGHIHVSVDDAPWHWADASGEPLIMNGFPAGPHKVLIELVNANHQTLDKGVVNFVIPKAIAQAGLPAQSPPDLSRQIADVMSQSPSGKAHRRFAHAKGIVCEGVFQSSPGAAAISRAAHLSGASVPVTVRFSDGAPDITVADNSPDATPRGMAIRFGSGRGTDIMTISHNGFIVGTGEDFLALLKALAATDASKPHPWPIEAFLGTHPKALKFVQDPKPVPVSFVTESFYSNNSFIFVDNRGKKRAGRYQSIPADGAQYLDDAAGKAKSPNFLREELGPRLKEVPARLRLLLQLAEPGDQTNDGSVVWPDDRKKIELGIITITSVVPDSAAAERKLAFDPTRLVDGIELSDDPLPALRSHVYAYSVAGRAVNRSSGESGK